MGRRERERTRRGRDGRKKRGGSGESTSGNSGRGRSVRGGSDGLASGNSSRGGSPVARAGSLSLVPSAWCVLVRGVEINLRSNHYVNQFRGLKGLIYGQLKRIFSLTIFLCAPKHTKWRKIFS